MPKSLGLNAWSRPRVFLVLRTGTSVLAGALALVYSRQLGIQNRSIVGFIMVTAITLIYLFASGITLTFRQLSNSPEKQNEQLTRVAVLLVTVAVIISGLSFLCLIIYSHTKASIPPSLLALGCLFTLMACLDYSSSNILVALGKLRTASAIEISTVFLQIVFYLWLQFINQTGLTLSLLMALSASYLFSTLSTLLVIFRKFNSERLFDVGEALKFIKTVRHNHVFSVVNGVADYSDKLIVAWFMPLAKFSQYSVMSGLINYVRFLPEALSNLFVAGHGKAIIDRIIRHKKPLLILGILLYLLSGGFIYFFTQLWFGAEWTLPIAIYYLFTIQELLRGAYLVLSANLIRFGGDRSSSHISVILICLYFLFTISGVFILGIYGVVFGQILAYLTCMNLSRIALKKIKNSSEMSQS